ncbi:MAG: cytochrome c [Pseudomonadota bacterium]|nr:cytochrome c [Pseudomonadota bacterium]
MKIIGFTALAIATLLTGVEAVAQSGSEITPDAGATYGQGKPGKGMGQGMHSQGRRGQGMRGQGRMLNMSRVRHQYVRRNGFDPKYAPKRNSLYALEANIVDGQQLYTQHCATCHGTSGIGDGEAGKALNPPPSNIARFAKTTMATDPYLMWTLSEGGAPIATAMPAFASVLNGDEIWKIILYLRQM